MSRDPISSPFRRLRRKAQQIGVAATVAGSLVAASALGLASPAEAAPLDGPYVALGDSYSAGSGISPQQPNTGSCGRSTLNYPTLVRDAIAPTSFKDVTCGGAVVSSFSESFLFAPPQYDALTADTKLVTVGIGGNDVGFVSIAISCIVLFFLDNNGAPCKTVAGFGGTDSNLRTMDAWAPKLGTALDVIKQRSPQAKILVVGYPSLLPPTKAQCPSGGPIATGDVPYLYSLNQHLNTLIQNQAAAHGATYVDTFTSSKGHDFCQPSGVRWVEGIENIENSIPVHPNPLGMANTAKQVLAALG